MQGYIGMNRDSDIHNAVKISNLQAFTGTYDSLGGGEVNDTFLLDCGNTKVVLRIAKHEDQNTLKAESEALAMLDIPHTPKLLYYDDDSRINGRHWILESYIPGITAKRLNVEQFGNLGSLLASVHQHSKPSERHINAWDSFLWNSKRFGTERELLDHPDPRLQSLIRKNYEYFRLFQPQLHHIKPCLIHSDATPSNILVDNQNVGLIDWEFSKFSDPMNEFATIYYDDIELNNSKWRIKINPEERQALFEGYRAAGGLIDESRITFWMTHDKLGVATFLYWRINVTDREATSEQLHQYTIDYENVLLSLE